MKEWLARWLAGPGLGIGTPYTLSLGGMSRADVRRGPRFSSTAPGRHPHPLLHQISPPGLAALWRKRDQEPRGDGAGKLLKPGPTRRCGLWEVGRTKISCDGGRACSPGRRRTFLPSALLPHCPHLRVGPGLKSFPAPSHLGSCIRLHRAASPRGNLMEEGMGVPARGGRRVVGPT